MKYTLTKDQREGVDYMKSEAAEGACLLASDPGTGKTLVCVTHAMETGAQSILVIAPVQTIDGWENHFRDQGSRLPFRHITSEPKGVEALDDYTWLVPGVYFVSHEYYVRMAWMEQAIVVKGKPRLNAKGEPMTRKVKTSTWDPVPDLIIFDEIHRASNHESWTFKALMNTDAPIL